MLSDAQFRELISGHWTGPLPSLLRTLLSMLEPAYRWAVQRRNLQFDRGTRQVKKGDPSRVAV